MTRQPLGFRSPATLSAISPLRRPPPAVLLLVIALPLATLVAGGVTLAWIKGDGLDTVSDPVRRTAQMQQTDLASDREAARRGLSGTLHLGADGAHLVLEARPGQTIAADHLELRLEHPLHARDDHPLGLRRQGSGWAGPGFDAHTAWRVAVQPADGAWRLVGRWPRGGHALTLRPALPAEGGTDGPG